MLVFPVAFHVVFIVLGKGFHVYNIAASVGSNCVPLPAHVDGVNGADLFTVSAVDTSGKIKLIFSYKPFAVRSAVCFNVYALGRAHFLAQVAADAFCASVGVCLNILYASETILNRGRFEGISVCHGFLEHMAQSYSETLKNLREKDCFKYVLHDSPLVPDRIHNDAGDQQVGERDRNEYFPAEIHELVES